MKITDSLHNIISEQVLNNILSEQQDIDLAQLVIDNTAVRTYLGSSDLPTIDSSLINDVASFGLYSKVSNNEQGGGSTDNLTLPRSQADQIARSVAVLRGTLPVSEEHNTSITWTDSRVTSTVKFSELLEVSILHFFIDIELNNGDVIRASTYSRDMQIPQGWYGKGVDYNTTDTYLSNGVVINIGNENQTVNARIDDGSVSGGLYVSSSLPGIVEAIQQKRHVSGRVVFRLCAVRDSQLLLGPIRVNSLRISSPTHTVDEKKNTNVIQLQLAKAWDGLKKRFGIRCQYADHNRQFEQDHFLRYTAQVSQSATWKNTGR